MKTPPRPHRARAALACGLLTAVAIPSITSALSPPIPSRIGPGEVVCMGPGTQDEVGIVVNVTPVLADGQGNAMVAPGYSAPTRSASNVNYGPGSVDPNLAIVANTIPDEGICFKNSNSASVDVVMDRVGAISSDAFRLATDEGEPVRLIDTRYTRPVKPNGKVCYSDVPDKALVVNVTPLNASASGHGVLIPGDVTAPQKTASVNYVPGSVNPNLAIVQTDSTGKFCFKNSASATTDVIVDLLGHMWSGYTPAAPDGTAKRLLDTRKKGGAIKAGERRCFSVPGNPGDGAVINLTPVRASGPGDGLLISSNYKQRPIATSVNYGLGTVDPNVAIPAIGADGKVCYFNSTSASVDLVADHMGTIEADLFEPTVYDGSMQTRFDTRGPIAVP